MTELREDEKPESQADQTSQEPELGAEMIQDVAVRPPARAPSPGARVARSADRRAPTTMVETRWVGNSVATGGSRVEGDVALQLASDIGHSIASRWRALGHDRHRFAELAAQVLEEDSPAAHIDVADVIRLVCGRDVLPYQHDPEGTFGQPPVTLFAGRGFYVSALFWLDDDTSVHQHSFSGAFHVLGGASLHASYGFDQQRDLDGHLLLGAVSLDRIEFLEPGATRPIVAGRDQIHQLSHLVHPTVTIVVRQYVDQASLPQYSYVRPSIAFDPFHRDQMTQCGLQLLTLLSRTNNPMLQEMAETFVRQRDASATLQAVMRLQRGSRSLAEGLVNIVRETDEEFADALQAALPYLRHERLLTAARRATQGADERLLLALLLHLPDRDQIMRAIEQLRPGADAAQLAAHWACSVVRQTHGLDVSTAGEAKLRRMLRDASQPYMREDDDDGEDPSDAKALRYITGDSLVFAPLFR